MIMAIQWRLLRWFAVRIASTGMKKQDGAITIHISSGQMGKRVTLGKAAIGRCWMQTISVPTEKGKAMLFKSKMEKAFDTCAM